MRRLIPQVGNVALSQRGDAFTTLARSIVGQQVSVASAQRVWDQFAALSRSMTPRSVLKLKVDDMRAAACRPARWSTWWTWRCTSTAAGCT